MIIGLDGSRAIVLWWNFPAYQLLISGGVLVSVGILVWRTRATCRLDRAVDTALLSLGLCLFLARVEYVILNWAYFADMPEEILSLSAGGLGAHGAIIGAILGGGLGVRWFGVDLRSWLGALSYALPILAFAVWWGCAASSCAYGSEVANLADNPTWLVWEARGDFLELAPRYAVQSLGMVLSALAIVFVTVMGLARVSERLRVGLSLLIVILCSFWLGFLRGDPSPHLGGVRVDQLLDGFLIVVAIAFMVLPRRHTVSAS